MESDVPTCRCVFASKSRKIKRAEWGNGSGEALQRGRHAKVDYRHAPVAAGPILDIGAHGDSCTSRGEGVGGDGLSCRTGAAMADKATVRPAANNDAGARVAATEDDARGQGRIGAMDDAAVGQGQRTGAAEVGAGSRRCAVSSEGMTPVRMRCNNRVRIV